MESKFVSLKGLVSLFLFALVINSTFSQSLQDSLQQEDKDIVSSIAAYPEDVRSAILNVSQYPQKLVKLERIQSKTSQSFQDLIASYPRDVQEKFYDLSRYPDLIHQLVFGDRKNADQIKALVASYPAEVGVTVNEIYPSYRSELESMDKSYQQSEELMQKTIHTLPENVQADFRKVVSMPDVVNLLTDRIDLTVSLGEAYKNDPAGVKHNLDSANERITAQTAKDLDDYKAKVASDPKLQEELKNSAQDFATSYSETDTSVPTVVNNYYNNVNPYPYWFGYPYWYPMAVWYPRPLWYHTGFYYGVGGNMVIVGFPSYAYSNWFFSYGYNRYPRLYGHYNMYYNTHRENIINRNVYRGYNHAVQNHFSRNSAAWRGGSGVISNNRQRSGNNNRNAVPSSQHFRNSINGQGSNLNHSNVQNFHSQQFHGQTWNGVGGNRSSGGNFNRGGSFGGGHSSGSFGGGHSGGGGGRKR